MHPSRPAPKRRWEEKGGERERRGNGGYNKEGKKDKEDGEELVEKEQGDAEGEVELNKIRERQRRRKAKKKEEEEKIEIRKTRGDRR